MWPVNSGPAANVHSSVGISVRDESARYTEEMGLIGMIALVDAAIYEALLAGVARVHRDQGNTGQFCLVLDLQPKFRTLKSE